LINALGTLLDNSRLNLYFLNPEYGKDRFNLVSKDAQGKEIVLEAAAHFGHHKTSGEKREENIYISAPFFEGESEGERTGLLIHELVHLVLGRGDEAHNLATALQGTAAVAFDNTEHSRLFEKARKEITSYLTLKKELLDELAVGDRETSERIYKEWIRATNSLSDISRTFSRDSFQFIIMSVIGPVPEAMYLAEEIRVLSEKKFTPEVEKLIDDTVEEIVFLLFEEDQRKEWKKRILDDITTTNIQNILPGKYFNEDNFAEQKEHLIGLVHGLSTFVMSNATCDVITGAITVRSRTDLLGLRLSLVHEILHYLPIKDVLKTDDYWEFMTYAGQFSHGIAKMVEAGTPIEKAEEVVAPILSAVAGDAPAALALYQRGKELALERKNIFSLRPQASGGKAAYVSINDLIEEAIKVCEAENVPCEDLKLYLTYSLRPPQNIFEQRQEAQISYMAQQAVGVLLAGALVSQWQTTGKEPLVNIRDYFNQLAEVFGSVSKEDEEWLDTHLIPKLASFVGGAFGSDVEFTPSQGLDELGLWKYKKIDALTSCVEYWRASLIPAVKDREDRASFRKKAEELAYGHLLLAEYRALYKPGPSFESSHKDDLDEKAFKTLYDFMLIPGCIYRGHTGLSGDIDGMGAKKRDRYQDIPKKIRKVFGSLFDLGSPEVEKQVYESYPPHLQYINSILRIWSHYEGEEDEKLDDPRVEKGSKVEKALVDTYENGWKLLFFDPAGLSDEEVFEIIKEEIYPVFKELYEESQKKEEETKKREAERITEKLKRMLQSHPQPTPSGIGPHPGGTPSGIGPHPGGTPSGTQAGEGQEGEGAEGQQAGQGREGEGQATGQQPGEAQSGEGQAQQGQPQPGQPGQSRGKPTPSAQPQGPTVPTGVPEGEIDNSGPSQPGAQPSAISELQPPQGADTIKKVLNGEAGQSGKKYTRTKKPQDDMTGWKPEELADLDREKAFVLTGLTAEEQRIYNEWRRMLPEQLVRETRAAFSNFLRKFLGQKFQPSDDLSHEWQDIVNIKLSQPGTAKVVKKRPFPVKITFLIDKSGSMGFTPERILWARLMIMLFLEVMIEINEDYTGLFEWEVIVYDQSITRIGTFKQSRSIRRRHKARTVFDIMTAIDPGGWTDDKRAFATAIKETLDEIKKDDSAGINLVLAIGDGNFGSNPDIAVQLEEAERRDVYTRVISVGDKDANQDTVDTCGEKRTITPDSRGFPSIPKKCWESFLEILEDVTGAPVRDMSAYLGEATQEDVNPHLRRILEDVTEKDFAFLEGWGPKGETHEGRKGNLFEMLALIEPDRIDAIFRKPEDGLFNIWDLKAPSGKLIFEKEVTRATY
ncbi:MAG: hypothetical protein PVH45_04140, partial [Candidatus Omnitrophota bacterium]